VYSTAGADYVPVNQRLTFTANTRSHDITVQTIEDSIFEGRQPERICLRMTDLSEPCTNSVIIGDDKTIDITENDRKLFLFIIITCIATCFYAAEPFSLTCYTTTTSNSITGWHINLFYSVPVSFFANFQCARDDKPLQPCMLTCDCKVLHT